MARNTSDLPPEIIENILSRLPAKSLLRFKTVSKSWNTMISDPVFVQNHIRQSKDSNSDNLFLCHGMKMISSSNTCLVPVIKLEDRKTQYLQVIECPYATWRELCFCDGVILLTDDTYRRFVLWNPSTQKSTKLWHHRCCLGFAFGLCRDPTTDDFKVVIVSCYYYSVYSCKNKSWIILTREYEIQEIGLGVVLGYYSKSGVCVDGASYWLWNRHNETKIVYFDPRDDKFSYLQKPEDIDNDNRLFYVIELSGCLCLYSDGREEKTVRIWTKEKGIDNNNWKELMTVENVEMPIWLFQPLCLVGNKIVIRNKNLDILVMYNPYEKRFEEFEEDTRVFGFVSVPIPYIVSMFFPIEKPKPKTKRKQNCLQ